MTILLLLHQGIFEQAMVWHFGVKFIIEIEMQLLLNVQLKPTSVEQRHTRCKRERETERAVRKHCERKWDNSRAYATLRMLWKARKRGQGDHNLYIKLIKYSIEHNIGKISDRCVWLYKTDVVQQNKQQRQQVVQGAVGQRVLGVIFQLLEWTKIRRVEDFFLIVRLPRTFGRIPVYYQPVCFEEGGHECVWERESGRVWEYYKVKTNIDIQTHIYIYYIIYIHQEEENEKKKFTAPNDLSGCLVRHPTSRTERYSKQAQWKATTKTDAKRKIEASSSSAAIFAVIVSQKLYYDISEKQVFKQ